MLKQRLMYQRVSLTLGLERAHFEIIPLSQVARGFE